MIEKDKLPRKEKREIRKVSREIQKRERQEGRESARLEKAEYKRIPKETIKEHKSFVKRIVKEDKQATKNYQREWRQLRGTEGTVEGSPTLRADADGSYVNFEDYHLQKEAQRVESKQDATPAEAITEPPVVEKPVKKERPPTATPPTRKELRILRSGSRRQEREDKITRQIQGIVKTGAATHGIDLENLPSSSKPFTKADEVSIEENIKKMSSKDIAENIQGVYNMYGKAPQEDVPVLDKAQLEESARRQRKSRWSDALIAFGAGLQGRTVDRESLASTRYKRERDQQFQQYKEATMRNQANKNIWEQKRNEEVLRFVTDKLKDQTLTASEVEKYKMIEKEILLNTRRTALEEREQTSREEGTYYAPRAPRTTPADKYPNTKAFNKIPGSNRKIIRELAKASGLPLNDEGQLDKTLNKDQIEEFSAAILSKVYKTDADGNYTSEYLPGGETYLADLSDRIAAIEPINTQIATLEREQMIAVKDAKRRDKDAVTKEYDTKIAEAQKQLKTAQKELENIIGGTSPQSALDDFYN